MGIERVGTLALHNTLVTDTNKVRADLAELQVQISSGVKTRNFAGIQSDVELFVGLESKTKRLNSYIENNTVVISRLNTMDKALEQVIDAADQLQDLYALQRDGAIKDSINFELQARNLLENIAGQLNSNLEGRYLFAGSKTNTPPVITDPAIPQNVELGVPDDNYYQGNDVDLTIRPQDNFEFDYNVRANDPAFQKIISSVFLAIEGHNTDDDTLVAQAVDMINEGVEEAIAVRSNVNTDKITLEDINVRHENLSLQLEGFSLELTSTDILEATTEVATNQAILQASFQVFARLSSLQLSNFLN